MSEWQAGRVVDNRGWNDHLHSLQIAAPATDFIAGQYTRLALDIGDTRVARPYSFVNPPGEATLEFYFNSVPGGPLSNRLIGMKAGEAIWVSAKPAGFLTLEEVPEGKELWMLATGTAIGPFLSILRTPAPWRRFQRVMLAYAVRYEGDLSYREVLDDIQAQHADRFHWLPFVSREQADGAMSGRIPAAIEDRSLEQRLNMELRADHSQVMICGNPEMVRDSIAVLKDRGLRKNLRHTPGQVTVERYW